ncbi:MAG: hypothetical protein ACKOF9_03735, partial [Burkholderiales bacterium]
TRQTSCRLPRGRNGSRGGRRKSPTKHSESDYQHAQADELAACESMGCWLLSAVLAVALVGSIAWVVLWVAP